MVDNFIFLLLAILVVAVVSFYQNRRLRRKMAVMAKQMEAVEKAMYVTIIHSLDQPDWSKELIHPHMIDAWEFSQDIKKYIQSEEWSMG
jgi:K+-transporting ATPase A subunit